jgi:hypothetical protein
LTALLPAENKHLLEQHQMAEPQQVTVEFEHKGKVSKVSTDLSASNRLPIHSLQGKLMVASLDLISVNGKHEQQGQTHLGYTASDGLSLRTFAAGDVLRVTGKMESCCCGA